MAPGGLDSKTDACSKAFNAGITTCAWIKLPSGCRAGTPGLAETASAGAPEFRIWQQTRSPAEQGTGHFTPQQGALIATSACAIPQAKPAWSATRSASNAIIPVFTEITLISSTAPCNGLDFGRARLVTTGGTWRASFVCKCS